MLLPIHAAVAVFMLVYVTLKKGTIRGAYYIYRASIRGAYYICRASIRGAYYIYRASIRGAYFERKIATLKNMPIPLF